MIRSELAKKFVNFIDDYKIAAITKLINGDSASKNIDKKNGIKGILLESNENQDFERRLTNDLEPIDLDKAFEALSKEFINLDFLDIKSKLYEFEKEDNYKVSSIKTKITAFIKKELPKGKFTKMDSIIINRVLNAFKLKYDFENIEKYINIDLKQKKDEWDKTLDDINFKFSYSNWLDWASKNANNIGFATHIAKLTHSSIKNATNIYYDVLHDTGFLYTATLKNKKIEVSQTDSKLSPIGKFIQLSAGDDSIAEKIKKNDFSDLEEFSSTHQQLEKWKEDFSKIYIDSKPTCHSLLKQVYFPKDDDYHLLSPMASSSLDQAIFENVKYHNNNNKSREQKKAKKYNSDVNVWYPSVAQLMVTASNHTNASPLNGKRSGIRYLFPSTPPQWKSLIKPPINQSSLFWGKYDRRIWKTTKELQEYLLKLQDKPTNMHIRNMVKRSVNYIIDTLFDYVLEIQNMVELKGWSGKAENLKESHKLWLDPFREDENFQLQREEEKWKDEVCLDFGLWLNKKLEDKKMVFAKVQSDRWAKLLKKRLRTFEDGLKEMQ